MREQEETGRKKDGGKPKEKEKKAIYSESKKQCNLGYWNYLCILRSPGNITDVIYF